MKSSLASSQDRSLRHGRWTKTSDGWGGDEDVSLAEIDGSLPARMDWIAGIGNRWNLWVFDPDADVQPDDVLLVTDVGLALMVERVQVQRDLKGRHHHVEITATEHPDSYSSLDGAMV